MVKNGSKQDISTCVPFYKQLNLFSKLTYNQELHYS
ncbi:hypothetical protein PSGL111025_00020 [Psychrobacter glaciei]